MARPGLNQVLLNGTAIDSYVIQTTIEKKFNESFRYALLKLKRSIIDVFTFDDKSIIGVSVTIKRGVSSATELFEFDGYVESYSIDSGIVNIVCADVLKKGTKIIVTKSYDSNIDTSAGVQSEIFKDLYNTYTDLTADNTSVQNSGTVYTRSKLILNHRNIYEAANELCTTLDWQQYYKPSTGLVYFEPKGYTNSTTILQTGVNVLEYIKWDYKSDQLLNKLTVIGAEQEVETDEQGQLNVTANYNTTSVTLLKTPVSVKVFYGATSTPSTLLTGGDETTSGPYHYTVDATNKKLNWATTVTANYYVKTSYSYKLPTPIIRQDIDSQNKYYLSEKTIFKSDFLNLNDAENYAGGMIKKYSTPFRTSKIKVVNATDLEPGQQIRIIDNDNGIDDYFLIISVKIVRPYVYDEVEVSDELIRVSQFGQNIYERLRRLEEADGKSTDLLLHVIDLNESINYNVRDFKVGKRTIESGVLYYDSDTQGDWGSTSGLDGFNWGSTTDGNYTIVKINPGNNLFDEYLYDTTYKHSNTTATYSTANTSISFTAGQVYESELMSKGTDFAYLKVQFGSANTNDLTIQVTADGKTNWQTVTPETLTPMINISSLGTAIRITASTTTDIKNGMNANNERVFPAIRVIHEE